MTRAEIAAAKVLRSLSPREREVAVLTANDQGQCASAKALGITRATVKFHLKKVYAKLGIAGEGPVKARELRLRRKEFGL